MPFRAYPARRTCEPPTPEGHPPPARGQSRTQDSQEHTLQKGNDQRTWVRNRIAVCVFFINMAMVIGPTPPRRTCTPPTPEEHPPPARGQSRTQDSQEHTLQKGNDQRTWVRNRIAVSVFFINMAMVIGPTPPGTGVMKLHLGATCS